MRMAKQKSDVRRRAWNILRVALLWARKGGVFKRRLMMELGVVPKFLKNLGRTAPTPRLHYLERELSFDKTPIFHVKMHRPASLRFSIPCITPQVDFDCDFDEVVSQEDWQDEGRRSSFLKRGDEQDDREYYYGYDSCEERIPAEEQGIDSRAEEFIAKFYQQMRLQRQISYLQYQENQRENHD